MNLNEQWEQLNEPNNHNLEPLLKLHKIKNTTSINPLVLIKKNLFMSFLWCIPINALYIFTIYHTSIWYIQLCMIVPVLFTFFGAITSYKQYKSIGNTLKMQSPILVHLQRHLTTLLQWKKSSENLALAVYPFCAAGGFLVGLEFGSKKPFDEIISNPTVIIALFVSVIVLVPLGYFLAKWLFKRAYGQSIIQLQQNINALTETA